MINPVVESIGLTFNRRGITTLRFNFRGTGKSEGQYENGIGEGDDILAAIRYLLDEGRTTIYLAGYSFGAWVIAHMQPSPRDVSSIIMVAPPVALLPFEKNLSMPRLDLVITGEEDEIAPVQLIEDLLPQWNRKAQFEVIDYADHFFYGSFREFEKTLGDFIKKSLDKI